MSESPNNMLEQMYSSVFGNIDFHIDPGSSDEVDDNFAKITYIPLEAVIYNQQMQAQTMPTNILPGQNTGQQNVQGQYTVTDGSGNQRVQIGSGDF